MSSTVYRDLTFDEACRIHNREGETHRAGMYRQNDGLWAVYVLEDEAYTK